MRGLPDNLSAGPGHQDAGGKISGEKESKGAISNSGGIIEDKLTLKSQLGICLENLENFEHSFQVNT